MTFTATFGPINNVAATAEPGEPKPFHPANGRFLWWKIAFPTDCFVQFDTQGSTDTGDGTDTVLAIYTGESVDALTEVASDDDGGGDLKSLVSMTALAGVTYYVQVGMFDGTESCNIVLAVAADCPSLGAETPPTATQGTRAVAGSLPPPRVQIQLE